MVADDRTYWLVLIDNPTHSTTSGAVLHLLLHLYSSEVKDKMMNLYMAF